MTPRDADEILNEAETRIRTTMIGAWNAVEEYLGPLWGEGLEEDQLTRTQLSLRPTRDALRMRVMDIGNDEIRGLLRKPRRMRSGR